MTMRILGTSGNFGASFGQFWVKTLDVSFEPFDNVPAEKMKLDDHRRDHE
jgi:hypothetical protein